MDRHAHAAELPAIALHKLPVQLRMLVRVMGEGDAFRLVARRGGTPFTVPKSLRAGRGQELLGLVSPEGAAALVAELPGQTLQLPKYDSVLRQIRHQHVVDLRLKRLTLPEVALATAYSVRQVINICNAAGALGADELLAGQGDLFARPGPDDADDAPDDDESDTAGPTPHNPFGLQARRRPRKAAQGV